MKIRDRIRELRRVPARELVPNPKNWRLHPEKQSALLAGTLREIGYADALLARENEHGQLVLIDGHLRAETTPDAVVPVLVLDVSESEADKLLALIDPLSAMAESDKRLLESLVSDLNTADDQIQAYFDSILQSADQILDDSRAEPPIPELFQIVIECPDETNQRELFERLRADGLKCRLLNL